jgi:hypothetical protein
MGHVRFQNVCNAITTIQGPTIYNMQAYGGRQRNATLNRQRSTTKSNQLPDVTGAPYTLRKSSEEKLCSPGLPYFLSRCGRKLRGLGGLFRRPDENKKKTDSE